MGSLHLRIREDPEDKGILDEIDTWAAHHLRAAPEPLLQL